MSDSSVVQTVAVIGAGTMGGGIAQTFAQHGFVVHLCDPLAGALERARASIDQSLSKLTNKGAITAASADRARVAITMHRTIDAASASDLIVEAIVESVDAKRTLFGRLGTLARPNAILASNTSSISITGLAGVVPHPGRVVGMHFMNPVPLMPLVEIVRGKETSDETVASVRALTTAIGKTGVEARDSPGFIANRILMPMINEAAYALMEDVGTAEAIDTVMKLGMSHPMGPLALADLIGLDVCVAILDVMHEGFGNEKYRACPLLRAHVAEGRLGRKSGRGFFEYTSPRP